jgi:hypothetical protein
MYTISTHCIHCISTPKDGRTLHPKETYYSVKRDLLKCQKRPTTVSKETYYSVKRDLLKCQKRPTTHYISTPKDGRTLHPSGYEHAAFETCTHTHTHTHTQRYEMNENSYKRITGIGYS